MPQAGLPHDLPKTKKLLGDDLLHGFGSQIPRRRTGSSSCEDKIDPVLVAKLDKHIPDALQSVWDNAADEITGCCQDIAKPVLDGGAAKIFVVAAACTVRHRDDCNLSHFSVRSSSSD